MFADDVVAGHLTHPVLVRVLADLGETETPPNALEIWVVGMRYGVSKVDLAVTAEPYFCVLLNDAFAQARERDRQLEGRAWLGAFRQRKLLIHHRENASGERIDRDHGSVHIAKRFDRGGAYHRIFASRHIPRGDVVGERAGIEALVISAVMQASLRAASPGAAMLHLADLRFGARVFGELGGGLRLLGRRDSAGESGKISEREREYDRGSKDAQAHCHLGTTAAPRLGSRAQADSSRGEI